MEKIIKPISGFMAVTIILILVAIGIFNIFTHLPSEGNPSVSFWLGVFLCVSAIFIVKGLIIIQPNYGVVITFLGKYIGTIKSNGLFFINPLYTTIKLSLRAQSLESNKLKVNDKLGNPVDIAAVLIWQINDSYKAVFDVTNFNDYIVNQTEAAIRHLASSCPYDNIEDEHAKTTLRDGGEQVISMLENELNERLFNAGIIIKEARISHLAYSSEIAGAMLQRQQATAIIAARSKIVEGAVSMVEMALELLSKKQIVELDEEKKAAMVSNLMVVLCGERAATPVLNTGTIYQ